MDNLEAIWRSSDDLPARFGVVREDESQRRIFHEEVLEFIEESVKHEWSYKPTLSQDLCDEAFDVIYTVIGVLQAHGIPYHQFEEACLQGMEKNDRKTFDNGYRLVAGKIRNMNKDTYGSVPRTAAADDGLPLKERQGGPGFVPSVPTETRVADARECESESDTG